MCLYRLTSWQSQMTCILLCFTDTDNEPHTSNTKCRKPNVGQNSVFQTVIVFTSSVARPEVMTRKPPNTIESRVKAPEGFRGYWVQCLESPAKRLQVCNSNLNMSLNSQAPDWNLFEKGSSLPPTASVSVWTETCCNVSLSGRQVSLLHWVRIM